MRLTVDLIRGRLNKAVPGKWKTEITYMEEWGYEQFIKKINIIHTAGNTVYVIAAMNWSNPPLDTAEFIAHAPEDMKFLLDTIKALQQQIRQLQAQAAKMREAIQKELDNGYEQPCFIEALFNIDHIEYHNPADVEALKKAKEALEHCRYVIDQIAPQAIPRPTGGMQIADGALAAIAEVVEL